MRTRYKVLFILFWGLFFSLLYHRVEGAEKPFTRALWITRWEYSSPNDIKKIVENAAKYNFNVILFQVRGNGTTLYPSEYEPWAQELGGTDPGWDPLKLVTELAHFEDIQVHAWINVFPGWSGKTPPTDPHQLYNAHPDWFMWDEFGQKQRLNSHYMWLSPTNPDVQQYLLKICREIYTTYDVDGLHLDYVRFPASSYSYDPVSLKIFNNVYKSTPQEKPDEWSRFRRNSITLFVEALYQDMKKYNQNLELSASVIGDFVRGYQIFMQDCHGWMAKGIIDVIYPMLYSPDQLIYTRQLADHLQNTHDRHVFPGLEPKDQNGFEFRMQKALAAGCKGVAVFSYSSIFPNHRPNSALADVLSSNWTHKTHPSVHPWKGITGDTQGPFITQVKTIPDLVTPETKFKIAAQIIDPSNVYKGEKGKSGKNVYLVYDKNWPPKNKNKIEMKPVPNSDSWYITDSYVPPQQAGLDFRGRIFAWDDYHVSAEHPKRNLGYSDVWAISTLIPHQTFISAGYVGPVLQRPSVLEVDQQGNVWIGLGEEGKVVVLEAGGHSRTFPDLTFGIDETGTERHFSRITGLALSQKGTMYVADRDKNSIIYEFDIKTGTPLSGIRLDFPVSGIDCDNQGHIFALEASSTAWHVLDNKGNDLKQSPFGSKNTGNNIAVFKNGSGVFISDQTTLSVQHWKGAVEGNRARYWRVPDIPAQDIGLGKVETDSSDFVYVSHSQRGVITLFNRTGDILSHLIGGSPKLNAPKDIAVTATGDSLYVLEAVGNGPTKLSLWCKNKNIKR